MNLKKLLVVATAVTLATGAGTAAADGGNRGGGWRNVHVRFQPYVPPGTGTSDLVCFPALTDPAPIEKCVSNSTVTATQSGDVVGTTVQALAVASNGIDQQHLPQTALGTFDGTVQGCGDGRFLYVGRGTLDFTDVTNPVVSMTYTIVEGSGTGALIGITGRFEQAGPGTPPIHEHGALQQQR